MQPTVKGKPTHQPAAAGEGATLTGPALIDVRARVERVIDAIRPAVRSDGGDIELVGVTPEGVVDIRLHGACVGCPSSMMTLKVGVEQNLKDHVPEVREVRAID